MNNCVLLLLCFFLVDTFGQGEVYYIGGGVTEGVKVSSSVSGFNTNPSNTIDGSGMDAPYMEATRLLAQASLGYTEDHVQEVLDLGIEGWIEEQFIQPPSYLSEVLYPILERTRENFFEYVDREPSDGDIFGISYPRISHFDYSWWHTNMNNEDLLRHKVAFALSELLVISSDSQLSDIGEGLAAYYDLLVKHSFGNFRDLLFDVTMHPSMGFFLSHLNNPKADVQNNINPDENYAREIMQLFTIGLYELNLDGSRKKDENGNDIPTYDQADIRGLAKVFTGLAGGALRPERIDYFEMKNMDVHDPFFGLDVYGISHTDPMKMYEDWHEPGEKHILRNNIIPAGQTGMQDINMALDILFNHENVGPFISRTLIQRLIKSNPSPNYIERISGIFNDNGQGTRGDLKAVVNAILMDEEARSCEWLQHPNQGKLREPLIREVQFIRSLDKIPNELGHYTNSYINMRNIKQNPLASPTVFNFFLPDHQPVGALSEAGLTGPEFQIHDTHTSIGYINLSHQFTLWQTLAASNEEFPYDFALKRVDPDLTRFDEFNSDFESLINHLDKLYGHGRLSDKTRSIIRRAINPMKDWNYMYRDHTRVALNLFMISPDFTILK